jgi:hypothetical protein
VSVTIQSPAGAGAVRDAGGAVRRGWRIAWVGVFLIGLAAPAAARRPEFVVPPGQDELIAEIVGRGTTFPGACRFTGGQVDYTLIRATYACDAGDVSVELQHPAAASPGVRRTVEFAVLVQHGVAPLGFVEALTAHIRSRESAFRWHALGGRSRLDSALLMGALIPAAVVLLGGLGLTIALWRRRRSVGTGARWLTVPVMAAVIRGAGLVAIVLVVLGGTSTLGSGVLSRAAIWFGVAGVAGLFWLTVTGFFGYGSASRTDRIALLPFAVALVLREGFTLHSVEGIEIQFARGPIGRHSVVYPLLQELYTPLASDPHAFTMHLNGVLGALACLPIYLFVRQRLASRTAGFLCALFLAIHPLVVRFAPTDGPYSLLLASWFTGLALLSGPTLDAPALAGGILLLGIAATVRIEGSVIWLASLLLLDVGALSDAFRRHRVTTLCSVAAAAGLGAAQMYFVLGFNAGNFPAAPTLLSMISFVTQSGGLLAALTALGALSGMVTRRWLGLRAFVSMLVVVAPVAYSRHATGLHRFVPACALQAMVAGIGAYTLTAWLPVTPRRRWAAAVPGVLAALGILVQHRGELTKPYVFTEEYDLVRTHLRPEGILAADCTLLTFNHGAGGDRDLHDFAQVATDMPVLGCTETDCLDGLACGGCFYYVRSVACYFREGGVASECASGTTGAGDQADCLNETAASFERSVKLDPVEVRTIDVLGTFAEFGRNYPPRVEIGLFRVHPKQAEIGIPADGAPHVAGAERR